MAFLLARLEAHRRQRPETPFFVGLNGVQGVGKSTLVRLLAAALGRSAAVETLACSIDDLYLAHADQAALARRHAANPLLQHRGAPGKRSPPPPSPPEPRADALTPPRDARHGAGPRPGRRAV
jgi:D-glycerate 3-kinase